MVIEKVIYEVRDLCDQLADEFKNFINDPESFERTALEQYAWKTNFSETTGIKYEGSYVYLKYKCLELLNRIHFIKCWYSGSADQIRPFPELLEDYEYLIDQDVADILSIELWLEKNCKASTFEVEKAPKLQSIRHKGRTRKEEECELKVTEQAHLFYFLADNNLIPGKGNASEIAEYFNRITGNGIEKARKNIGEAENISNDERKKLIAKLKVVIQKIEVNQ